MAGGLRKSRTKNLVVNFTEAEKKQLASLVEMHPQLWNLAHPLYKRSDTHYSAWNNISNEMKYSADACKKVWKSLKDGLRYRRNPKKPTGKSGDSGPEDDSDYENVNLPDQEIALWPFWECMKFVAFQKTNRRTTSSVVQVESTQPENGPENENEIEPGAADPNSQIDLSTPKNVEDNSQTVKSNYDYAVKRKRARTEDSTEKLASGIADLIKMRKNATAPSAKVEPLKYHSMYVNLDRMLSQLPSVIVEELNMQFVNLAYEAIKRQQNIIVIDENN